VISLQPLKKAMLQGLKTMCGSLIAGAASGALTCLFVLAVVLAYQVAVSGSAADWIASLANAVMAVAAVLAFIVARSWLPQLTTQEGYKLTIQLVNDHYIWLGLQNSLLREVGLPMAYIRHLQDGKAMAGSDLSYENIMAALNATLLEHKIRRDTMAKIRFQLGTYGLHEAHPVRERFQALDRAYQNACDKAATLRNILTEMREILIHVPHYKPGSGMLYAAPLDEKLMCNRNDAEQTYITLSENYSQMLVIHNELFSAQPPIGKLFQVRR